MIFLDRLQRAEFSVLGFTAITKMAAVLLYSAYAAFVLGVYVLPGVSADSQLCASGCSCLYNLVDCSRSKLDSIPKDLPVFVTRLELQYNKISEITAENFEGLDNLTQLDLSYNEIRLLDPSVFKNLPALKVLKINHNKITEVPMLKGLGALTSLELNQNRIHTLAMEFLTHMSQLKSLELKHNQIMDLPPGVFPANNSLQKLTLNGNGLESFAEGCFNNLTELEVLKMNKNRINRLQKTLFDKMTNLKVLEMTKNQLRVIKGISFHKLTNLQALRLRKNQINTLEDGAFWGLGKIQILELDHNQITNVTQRWLYRLKSLKQLNLSNNLINVIDANSLEVCEVLESLDLSNNRIDSIKRESFAKLHKLQALYLNNNRISNIDDGAFRDLVSLELMELNNNAISWTIEDMNGAFVGLVNLNKLGLESNRIKSIAQNAFKGLSKVKVLNLQNNAIASIQRNALESMDELVELSFNSSSLLCDCQLSWLPQWLQMKQFEKTVTAVCAHPKKLQGKSIYTIDQQEFKCEGEFLHPLIKVNPKSQIALKGENITLNCSAASTKQSHTEFTWKKDNVLILDPVVENLVRVEGDFINYTSRLHLNKIHHNDAGRYQCVISNEFGSAYSQKAEIGVHVLPVFVKTPVDVTVRAGQTARLECSAIGEPEPTIAWKKDGGVDFPAATERRMHVMSGDVVFFIVEVKSQDQGVYSCTAANDAGNITVNATLKVLETPSFVRPMEKYKITAVGETTVLECMASGSPQPKLTWLKNDKPLEPNQRYFFTANNQLLIIVQTSHSDEGRYTCMMTNTLGQDRGVTQLTVTVNDHAGPGVNTVIQRGSNTGPSDESTTTGIIIIAVVCCVVGTSLVWVIIIYQTRKRHEMYSATPTDETTLPGEIPSSGYTTSSDKEGSFTQPVPMTMPNYQYQEYQMKESGYESSSGRFRAARAAAIFPSDVDEEDNQQSMPLTLGEHQLGTDTPDNSESSLHYPNSDTDSMKSSHSTNSTHASEQHMLRTFHPVPTNHDTLRSNRSASVMDTSGAKCEQCQNDHCHCANYRRSLYSGSQQMDMHHGSQPQPPGIRGDQVYRSEDKLCDNQHQVTCNCHHQVVSPTHNSPVNLPNSSTVCNHHMISPSPTPHGVSQPPSYVVCHHPSQLNTRDCRMCAKPSTCVAIDSGRRSHRNSATNLSVDKNPPVIPPKTRKHSLTHSKMNGTVSDGKAVDV